MVDSASITNRAAAQIGAQATVTGAVPNLTGGGAVSGYANTLYQGVVEMLLRDADWEFSRTTAPLAVTGNVPLEPWQFEYEYPTDCLKIRQITPATLSTLDPQPVQWSVAERASGKVIGCNIINAQIVYTTNAAAENEWDPMFQETVVRMLASELSMAGVGRPDFSRVMLGQSASIMQSGQGKDS